MSSPKRQKRAGGNRTKSTRAHAGSRSRKSLDNRADGHSSEPDNDPDSTIGATKKRRVKSTRPSKLRIIAGDLRGRSIQYHGAEYTRPMRDTVRENLFNILGQTVKSSVCVDLFSGTGALAFESISRGADRAIAIERSRHAADVLKKNASTLGVSDRLSVINGDAFRMASTFLGPPTSDEPDLDTPKIVFLCPPYSMWETSLTDLNRIITSAMAHCAPGSVLVAESDKHFDPDALPQGNWDHRVYGNTRLSFIQPELVCGLRN